MGFAMLKVTIFKNMVYNGSTLQVNICPEMISDILNPKTFENARKKTRFILSCFWLVLWLLLVLLTWNWVKRTKRIKHTLTVKYFLKRCFTAILGETLWSLLTVKLHLFQGYKATMRRQGTFNKVLLAFFLSSSERLNTEWTMEIP